MSFLTCHSPIDVCLPVKRTPFSSFVANLPSVKAGSVPLDWFLSWPHASTLYSALANFESVDHVFYKRFLQEHEDGGNNTLDFAVRTAKGLSTAEYENSGDRSLPPRTRYMTPAETEKIGSDTEGVLVVLIHGLAGGSHENYIRKAVSAIFRQYEDDSQVSVVAFNARGCARSKVTSKTYWNAYVTDDISEALDFLAEKYPKRKIMCIGFSLGANILCNYLARFGDRSKVSLGISVSNPWDLLASSRNLHSYWLGRLYSTRMAAGLQRLFKRHAHMIAQHERVDQSAVMAAKSLREFDQAFTAQAFGFDTADQYYEHGSSSRVLQDVRTDLIIINAKDDPLALDPILPYGKVRENGHLCMLAVHNGGHIGWYGHNDRRWFIDVITESLAGFVAGEI